MFEKLLLLAMALITTNATAHVGGHEPFQHASEHLLLVLVLIPVAWVLIPYLRRVLIKLRRK